MKEDMTFNVNIVDVRKYSNMKGHSVQNLESIVLWCCSQKRNFLSFFLECGGLLKCDYTV